MTAPVNTGLDATFDVWRQNTNTVSTNVGNPVDLITIDKSSTVAAINETRISGTADAIVMAIALG